MTTIALRTYLAAAVTLAAGFATPSTARAQGGFEGPGRYEILIVSSGKALDLDRNDKTSVMQYAPTHRDNQQWDAHPAEGGYWVLRNVMTGAALECMGPENGAPVRGMPFTQSPAQQWRIEASRDGYTMIVSRLGKTMDVTGNSRADGARLQAYEPNGRPNQHFVFHLLSAPTPAPQQGGERGWERERGERWAEAHSGRYDENDRTWKLDGDGVCFYRGANYTGKALCIRTGEDMRRVPDEWLEMFRSVRFFGNVRGVMVFHDPEFQGDRVRIDREAPDLEIYRAENGKPVQRTIRSARVF